MPIINTDMTDAKIDLGPTGLCMHRAHTNPIRQFQVFGERGSGTNVIRKTLQLNVKMKRVESLGWKHGFPQMVAIPNNLLVICVVRDAWRWAQSMHKRPWHSEPDLQELSFSDFIRAEWRSIVDRPTDFEMLHDELTVDGVPLQFDRHPITGKRFENLFALRTAKLQALAGFANRNCSFLYVTLESFNEDPEGFVKTVCETYDVARRPREFRFVERRMGNLHNRSVKLADLGSKDGAQSDFAFMAQQLDHDLEALFGYSYV